MLPRVHFICCFSSIATFIVKIHHYRHDAAIEVNLHRMVALFKNAWLLFLNFTCKTTGLFIQVPMDFSMMMMMKVVVVALIPT